jgi:nucleotide-binding universal stress UspA family protein
MLPIRNILCPIDFSSSSFEALAIAIELGEHFSATVHVLYVLELQPVPADSSPLPWNSSSIVKHREELEANAKESMANVVAKHSRPSLKLVTMIVGGAAAQRIVESAEEMAIDLVVISTHGRTGFRRLVFGSVAEAVMRTAPCPVLTTRPVQAQDSETAA